MKKLFLFAIAFGLLLCVPYWSQAQTTIEFNDVNGDVYGLSYSEGGFTFSINDPGNGSVISGQLGGGYGDSKSLRDNNAVPGAINRWTIKKTDGTAFKFIGIFLRDAGQGASPSGTITAYKGVDSAGTPVPTAFDGSYNQSFATNPDFFDVDEIRIEAPDINFYLDHFTYGPPDVVGANDPAEVVGISLVGNPVSTATTISYTVTFSKAASNVDVSDFVLTTVGSANGTIASVSGSGTTYAVMVNAISGEGNIRLDLKAGTNIENDAGVGGTSAFTGGQAHYVRAFPPAGYTVSINQNPITLDNETAVSFTFAGAEVGTTYNYTFNSTGSIPVTGSGTITSAAQQVTGIDLSGLNPGTVTLSVTLTDASGNEGAAATSAVNKIINNDPTGITLSGDPVSINQSTGVNAMVGLLSSTDVDAGDTHTYSLVMGTGDDDNVDFDISDFRLLANNTTSMPAGAYSVRIRTTDNKGGLYEKAFTITVVDDVKPTVSSVSVPANAIYRTGQNLDFTVNLSEKVTVSGTPRIPLTIGSQLVSATYLSGSATNTLLFRYTVHTGETDTDGIQVGASIDLNEGTINDDAGLPLVLTLNSVGSTAGVRVDGINDKPTISGLPANITIIEDTEGNLDIASSTFADEDSDEITITLSVSQGTIFLAASGGIPVLLGGNGTASITVAGSPSAANQYIGIPSNIIYKPRANSNGTEADMLVVTANDGDGSGEVELGRVPINITAVNDAPVITAPATIGADEDVLIPLTGISFSDVDAGNADVTVTFSVASGTLTALSGARVTISGSESGSLTMVGSIADLNAFIAAANLNFTTALNATADVTLSILIDDGGNTGADPGNSGTGNSESATTTVTLLVRAINDAPVNTVPSAQTVNQDESLVFSTVNGNSISVSDVDAGSNPIQLTLRAINGLITLGSQAGLTFIAGTGAGDATMTFQGTIAALNAGLEEMIFVPANGFNGTASLEVITSDLANTGSGGELSDTDLIGIHVMDQVPPAIPENLTSTAGDAEVALGWAANTDADLSVYKIYGGISADPSDEIARIDAGTLTFTHTGLVNGTEYYYRISALDLAGNESGFSAAVQARPMGQQTITFGPLADAVYGDEPMALSASSTSGLLVSFTSSDPSIVSISSGLMTIHAAGSVTIMASQPGNTAYLPAAPISQTLVINKAVISGITFDEEAFIYDGTPKSLVVGGTLPENATVVYSGNEQTQAGEYVVTATISQMNYQDLVLEARLIIAKAQALITADAVQSHVYDGTVKNVQARLNHTENALRYSPQQGYTAVGTYEIDVSVPETKNYFTAAETIVLEITPAEITGLVFEDAHVVYDGKVHALTVRNLPEGATVTYAGNEQTQAGIYTVTATVHRANHQDVVLTGTLTIAKAVSDITADAVQSHVYDGTVKNVQARLNHTETALSYSPARGYRDGGTYTIIVSADETDNYLGASREVQLIIDQADLSGVVFTGKTVMYTGQAHVLEVENLPEGWQVDYLENSQTDAGNYVITARINHPGNPETIMTANLIITKASQEISFQEVGTVSRDAGRAALQVSSSSDLPVGLSSDDPFVATVEGQDLLIHRLGTVRITATQPGDKNHEAAEPVSIMITIADEAEGPVKVSKVISPNGDGINDFLILEGIQDYPDNRLQIFSRNGLAVFNLEGYDNDTKVFKGQNNIRTSSEMLPEGTYFYSLRFRDGNQWKTKKGWFVLKVNY